MSLCFSRKFSIFWLFFFSFFLCLSGRSHAQVLEGSPSQRSIGLQLGYFHPYLEGDIEGKEKIEPESGHSVEMYYEQAMPSLLQSFTGRASLRTSFISESYKGDGVSSDRVSLVAGPLWSFLGDPSRKGALRLGFLFGLTQESVENTAQDSSASGLISSSYFLTGYEYDLGKRIRLESYLRLLVSPDKHTILIGPGLTLGVGYRFD